jgi:glycosyltransferase involved in cell wall biosynthesis
MSAQPLVTIGLPVYNGLPHLRAAVDTLLAQTYPNVEIIVSDNASTDGTGDYCRALAEVHPRVKYFRNATNVGPGENFRLVLERARGEYFMWASHDDKWNATYVAALAGALATAPAAVLATPAVFHIREDGTLCSEPPDRPATGDSRLANLKLLYADHAASWIFGLWRTAWVREHVGEYGSFPYWGADVLWLADICLRHAVVGNQEAVIYKRWRPNSHAPHSARAAVAMWGYMFWHLSRMAVRRVERPVERLRVLALSWGYVYRLCIRRPHLLRTAWRVVRMLAVAGVTSAAISLGRLGRRLARALPPALEQAGRRHV